MEDGMSLFDSRHPVHGALSFALKQVKGNSQKAKDTREVLRSIIAQKGASTLAQEVEDDKLTSLMEIVIYG